MKKYIALLVGLTAITVSAQTNQGPFNTPQMNSTIYIGSLTGGTSQFYPTIQSGVTAGCAAGINRIVSIPAAYAGSDSISAVTGGCVKTWIYDERAAIKACWTWSGSAYANTGCGVTQIIGPSSSVSNTVIFTGSGVSQSGNTFTFSGGSSITWPTSGDLVLSNGTNSPAGLPEVDGDCAVGAGGAWTTGGCGSGTVTSFAVGSWPNWLTPTVTDATTTPSLAVAASTIPTSAGGTGETSLTGVRYANGAAADTAATTSQMETAIGSGVYDASGAAATAQSNAQTFASNASNISSGTLGVGRLPTTIPMTGDVTGTTGANTVTKIQGNAFSNAVPLTGQSPQWNGTAWVPSTVTPGANNYSTLQMFGTSIVVGWGATSYGQFGALALLAGTTTSPAYNYGIPGALLYAVTKSVFENFAPDPNLPSATVFEAGENDAVPSGAAQDASAQNAYMAVDAWLAIPQQNKITPYTATLTGTWTSFDEPALQPGLSQWAKFETTSTNGATATFNVPSNPSSYVIIWFHAPNNSNAGTFTASVNGTLETDDCTNTTSFQTAYCGGYASGASTGVFYAEMFPAPANTAYSVVITNTNGSPTDIVGVGWPAVATNENLVLHDGIIPSFGGSALNTIAQSVVTTLQGVNLPVYYVNMVSGSSPGPGVNTTTDVSTTATTLCPASSDSPHPNNCGQLHEFQTIVNTMVANHLSLGSISQSGRAFTNSGQITSPIVVNSPGNEINNLNAAGTIPHQDAQWYASGGDYGVTMYATGSSSYVWQNQYVEALEASDGWDCTANGYFSAAPPITTFCVDPVGDLYPLGHLSQAIANTYAGSCTMASATTCTFSISVSYTTPLGFASPQTPYSGGQAACTVSGTTVTITAPTSNSQTWNCLLIGNPY